MGAHNLLSHTYAANVRNSAYLMERACVAAANAESPEAWSMRQLFARDAHNLVAMARERLAANLGA